MTNRQLAALETKKKLLHAAKEIICEKGLANVSVAEITKKCGVANGTFYTYFKRKEDIVFALAAARCIRRFWTKLLSTPAHLWRGFPSS